MDNTTLTVIQVLQRIKAKYGEQVTEDDVTTVKAIAGMDSKTINALMIFMWGAFQGGVQTKVATKLDETKQKADDIEDELKQQEQNYILPMMDDINQLNSDVSGLSGQISALWSAIAGLSQG